MKKNKIILFLLLFLIVLNTVLVIYLANFRYYAFNENYYKKQFEKNNVYDDVLEADIALNNLFLFFKKDKELNDFFGENEKSHLNDVKLLIDKIIVIFYFLIILEIFLIFSLYFLFKKNIKKHVSFTLVGTSIIIILISALLYIVSHNFQFMFVKFHEIFFPQGNWSFPADSNLIKMFPQSFFYGFFYKIILNSFVVSLAFFPLIYYLLSRKK